jgi:hypothetical protein
MVAQAAEIPAEDHQANVSFGESAGKTRSIEFAYD